MIKGARVLLSSGDLEKVENIRIGDLLIGDGDTSEVKSVEKGFGPAYKVSSFTIDGDLVSTYKVTENHTITVKLEENTTNVIHFDLDTQQVQTGYFMYLQSSSRGAKCVFQIEVVDVTNTSDTSNAIQSVQNISKESQYSENRIKIGTIFDISVKAFQAIPECFSRCLSPIFSKAIEFETDYKGPQHMELFTNDLIYHYGQEQAYSTLISSIFVASVELRNHLVAGIIDSCGYFDGEKYIIYFRNDNEFLDQLYTNDGDFLWLSRSLGYFSFLTRQSSTQSQVLLHGPNIVDIPSRTWQSKTQKVPPHQLQIPKHTISIEKIHDQQEWISPCLVNDGKNAMNRFLLFDFSIVSC